MKIPMNAVMKVVDGLMTDRVSISHPALDDAGTFDPDTLNFAEATATTVYTGPAMVSNLSPMNPNNEAYPAVASEYSLRISLEARAVEILNGDIVTILSTARPEISMLVGKQFVVTGENLGTYSASRKISMVLREAINR